MNDFPESYFHPVLRAIISEVCETNRFHKDFLSTSIMSVAATAIGNTYSIHISESWKEKCTFFMALVGSPGVNKSAPLTWALSPLEQKERETYKRYLEYLKDFSADDKNAGKTPGGLIKTIVSDATPEAVVQQLEGNERGILIYNDELSGFINTFQRYSKGNDEQFYLSVWSGKPVVVDRKTTKSIRINQPFLNVIGTIQPGVLEKSFHGKEDSGFFDRWLICKPQNIVKEYWSDVTLEPATKERYMIIIQTLMDIPIHINAWGDMECRHVEYSPEALRSLKKWQRQNTDHINITELDNIKAIRSKIETYVHRFCLLKHLLDYACSDQHFVAGTISVECVNESVLLCDYFIQTALSIRSSDPADILQGYEKDIYNTIPEDTQFTTKQFVDICTGLGLKERTAKRWIDKNCAPKGKLLTKLKHGIYIKN